MRLFRSQNNPDAFWPLDYDEAVSAVMAGKESENMDDSVKMVLDLGSSRKPIL